MTNQLLTHDDFITALKASCLSTSQKHMAEKLGTSPEHLNRILHGKFEISSAFAERLGYKRVVLFEKATAVATDASDK